jgi:hypothetical protein
MDLTGLMRQTVFKTRYDIVIKISEWRPELIKGSLPFGRLSVLDDILRDTHVAEGLIGLKRRPPSVEFCNRIPENVKQRIRNVLLLSL